ncbi:PD-(D/E)XK nuclease family protein [Oleidesulfovibrio sp.]|uniref:PD-(D/E)XK nuclease family protein n=1 Tax=Oleidesulfovibrio sp. TaxID=2909707 RepID=UPI003A88D838
MTSSSFNMPASLPAGSVGIVPWQNDFLQALLRVVLQETAGNTGNAVIIFPHGRPRRYLTELFRTSPLVQRPCLMPQMLSVSEFLSGLRAQTEPTPPKTIELLDRVGLLFESVQALGLGEQNDINQADLDTTSTFSPRGPLTALPLTDAKRFFPWGVRLAALLEDFYNQGMVPDDYHYMEGDVVDFAARLLEQLGSIHHLYTAQLDACNWTTPGYDAFRAVSLLDNHIPTFESKQFFIAGFYGLTGVEKKVFTTLREQYGARFILHTDPAIAEQSGRQHWSCREHVTLLKDWKTDAFLLENPEDITPAISYYEGFDLHSQLDALSMQLREATTLDNSAIVLPDSGMLMPLLHHLPQKDINISMGYPLGKSPLSRLLDTIMDLQEERTEAGYPWRKIIDLIRHPYLKMLAVGDERPLQRILHALENSVRKGARHTDPRHIEQDTYESTLEGCTTSPEEARQLLERIFALTLSRWEQVTTPYAMAEALSDLCVMLIEQGGDMWSRFPVDAECMYRLIHHVIPALRESHMSRTTLTNGLLFTILREMLNAERVPFEAEPLTGLQVLGMLESRLLRFNHVYVMDATEDNLPGAPGNDPLLPENLRGLLGLPDIRHRERVSAYNFFRLINGARKVTLLYQAGTSQSGLLDEKKLRSRFLEELVWQEEQRQEKLLVAGSAPIHAITYTIPAISMADVVIERSEAINQKVQEFLSRPVAPTALDTYLTCPVRFFYERLCKINPAEEVNEGDDPLAVGDLLHGVLQEFYTPLVGKEVSRQDLNRDSLCTLFRKKLFESDLKNTLPYDSYAMLKASGPERLIRFINNQPDLTRIIKLEEKLEAAIEINGAKRWLTGRLDRVDERDGKCIILDYKTGSVQKPRPPVWQDEQLWKRLAVWQPDQVEDDPLTALADNLHSIQLPFYIHLYGAASGQEVGNAGWVALREHGKEELLLPASINDETLHYIVSQQIPTVLAFILRHLASSSSFRPRRGKHCDWCFYANLCTFRPEGPTG